MGIMTENVQIILLSLAALTAGMGVFIAGVYAVVQRSQGAATGASGTLAWSMTGAGKSRVSDPAYLATQLCLRHPICLWSPAVFADSQSDTKNR